MISHHLLIDCPDQKGIIYHVTRVLFEANLNIAQQDEFVDEDTNRFFMRTELIGEVHSKQLHANLRAALPQSASIKLIPNQKKQILILVTKEAHCLGDLLIRHAHGDLGAEIVGVISNHTILQELTERFGLPFHHIPHKEISRAAHEEKVCAIIDQYPHDYLVLAKYMRILTKTFIQRFNTRIVNIHHSFLPSFIGARPYHQAFNRGVKIIGATAHIATENLDEGPIIAQDIIRINHTKTPRDMARAGHDVEKIVLANALRLLLEDRVIIHGNKTVIFD